MRARSQAEATTGLCAVFAAKRGHACVVDREGDDAVVRITTSRSGEHAAVAWRVARSGQVTWVGLVEGRGTAAGERLIRTTTAAVKKLSRWRP